MLSGTEHPHDVPILRGYKHSFDLNYPPPAFLGDIVNAPVIALFANGGLNDDTPSEFPTSDAFAEYVDLLHNPKAPRRVAIAPYYGMLNFSTLLFTGKIALVNAVAYRSRRISEEPENQRVGRRLPSYSIHRNWLLNEVLPLARQGERLIVVHRNGLWQLPRSIVAGGGVVFSSNPVSANFSKDMLAIVEGFLRNR
jgi:hypothetical protein